MALGRQAVISRIKSSSSSSSSSNTTTPSTQKHQSSLNNNLDTAYSVAEEGFGGIEIEVLCAGAHASIRKAASIVGIGRSNVFEIVKTDWEGADEEETEQGRRLVAFDLKELERRLDSARKERRGVIVCPAYGEVNTVSLSSTLLLFFLSFLKALANRPRL